MKRRTTRMKTTGRRRYTRRRQFTKRSWTMKRRRTINQSKFHQPWQTLNISKCSATPGFGGKYFETHDNKTTIGGRKCYLASS